MFCFCVPDQTELNPSVRLFTVINDGTRFVVVIEQDIEQEENKSQVTADLRIRKTQVSLTPTKFTRTD